MVEKKEYEVPVVCMLDLQQQQMLCGSGGAGANSMSIHDKYSDSQQLSNKNLWNDIW